METAFAKQKVAAAQGFLVASLILGLGPLRAADLPVSGQSVGRTGPNGAAAPAGIPFKLLQRLCDRAPRLRGRLR